MVIKGHETSLKGKALIEALLNDEFGYNHICKCGVAQTADGCKSMLRIANQKGNPIDHDFVCATCRKSRPCTVFGKEYPSVKIAAEESYDPEVCKCEVCGKVFTKDQWLQWCKKYLDNNNGRMICHSCKSSEVRIELNERDHEMLSQMTRDRNLKNWQDDEYRNYHSQVSSECATRLWQSTEKKYGDNGNLTFAEVHNIKVSKKLSAETDGEWSKPYYWNRSFLGRTRLGKDKSFTEDQKFCWLLDDIDKLHSEYSKKYSSMTLFSQSLQTKYDEVNSILDELGIKHAVYSNYIMMYNFSDRGHHVVLQSIKKLDEYQVKLTIEEHIIAHFLLFLDNFTTSLNENLNKKVNFKLTEIQIKTFMGFFFIASHSFDKITDPKLKADITLILGKKE